MVCGSLFGVGKLGEAHAWQRRYRMGLMRLMGSLWHRAAAANCLLLTAYCLLLTAYCYPSTSYDLQFLRGNLKLDRRGAGYIAVEL